MNEIVADATERAAELDANAVLTQINAVGLEPEGYVDLVGETGFVRRWNIGFWNHDAGQGISVIYMSESWPGDYPDIEYPAGNISEMPAIANPGSLPNSDAIANAFAAAAGCPGVTGDDSESMIVRNDPDLGGNLVQFVAGGTTWGAQLDGAYTEWDSCN
jgi:hypothetical protein